MAEKCERRFRCRDCGLDTGAGPGEIGEYYSVHDAVWAAARMQRDDGMLCIGCLETRLGRRPELVQGARSSNPALRNFLHGRLSTPQENGIARSLRCPRTASWSE
jgi:hypothetical protein